MSSRVLTHDVRSMDPAQLTLGDQHALLLQQVASRADDVLTTCAAGEWPGAQAQSLVAYLRAELLVHAACEERSLFPDDLAAPGFDALGNDHARLHMLTEAIAAAAAERSAPTLTRCVRDLLGVLEGHLDAEERLLGEAAALSVPPGHDAMLAEGPVIDFDLLPHDRAIGLVINRLLRLRPGQEVEIGSTRHLDLVWLRMNRIDPGGYGFAYLHDGPDHWALRVMRRSR